MSVKKESQSMMKNYLQLALNCGYDIIIQMDYCCNSRYCGKITDIEDNFFTLLQINDSNTGIQWVLKIDDIRYFGILREKPVSESCCEIHSTYQEDRYNL
jgi:hypothetical protein